MRALQALTPKPFVDLKFDTHYVCIPKPWLRVWWTSGRWPREIREEHCWRNTRGIFLGYHNVKYHHVRPTARDGLYVLIPNWWRRYKFYRSIPAPLPAVVAYWGGLHDPRWTLESHSVECLSFRLDRIRTRIHHSSGLPQGAALAYSGDYSSLLKANRPT